MNLKTNHVSASWWKTKPYRGRPKTIPPDVAATLLQIIAKREQPKVATFLKNHIEEQKQMILPASLRKNSASVAFEGTQYERLAWQPVRGQALRNEKLRQSMKKGRLTCEVRGCGFDFFDTYGELGRGFAHVHHRRSLAKGKEVRTKLADLAVVCANCHAMIHRGGQCRLLDGLIASK